MQIYFAHVRESTDCSDSTEMNRFHLIFNAGVTRALEWSILLYDCTQEDYCITTGFILARQKCQGNIWMRNQIEKRVKEANRGKVKVKNKEMEERHSSAWLVSPPRK